jgi:ATP-dependent DNA helicase RecQ
VGDPLFEALREKRRELAKEAQVPPYVIFHDSVLRELAALKPDSLAQMSNISGVGAKKLDAYGDAFLQVIRETA